MKRCCIVIALGVLVMGCDAASRSITGPISSEPTDATTYTITGRIQDGDGKAVSDAVVQLTSATTNQTVRSDERGEYRITGVRGVSVLKVTKVDYGEHTANVFVAADQTVNVTLYQSVALILTAGVPLRGTIQGPPCEPAWAGAPCVTVRFTPPSTGPYEFVITWKGPSAGGLLVDRALYWESYSNEIKVVLQMEAGVQRELRVFAYHLPFVPEEFELTATRK